jgi:hypothetical protein
LRNLAIAVESGPGPRSHSLGGTRWECVRQARVSGAALPNDNSAIWSPELSFGLLEGPEGVSCVGVLAKGEDPNSRPGAAPP